MQSGKPSFKTGRANFTRVCHFSVLLIKVLTTKRREWTIKHVHLLVQNMIVFLDQRS